MTLADVQAALPFMIMALSVQAFFGTSMVLLVCLMGFYGWEHCARIARGLAISTLAQGYAAAVLQLGATTGCVHLKHILHNVAPTLIVSMTLTFPEIILMGSGLSVLGLGDLWNGRCCTTSTSPLFGRCGTRRPNAGGRSSSTGAGQRVRTGSPPVFNRSTT